MSGLWYSAEYSTFTISDEAGKYRLWVSRYSGDAGDAIREQGVYDEANWKQFSTPDRDNEFDAENCAFNVAGGWWFGTCLTTSVLNSDTSASWIMVDGVQPLQASRMLVKIK